MSVTTCPVLTPSAEEFKDFRKYLATIDDYFDEGIVKVIPPKEFIFTRDDYDKLDIILPHYYEQRVRRAAEDEEALSANARFACAGGDVRGVLRGEFPGGSIQAHHFGGADLGAHGCRH